MAGPIRFRPNSSPVQDQSISRDAKEAQKKPATYIGCRKETGALGVAPVKRRTSTKTSTDVAVGVFLLSARSTKGSALNVGEGKRRKLAKKNPNQGGWGCCRGRA